MLPVVEEQVYQSDTYDEGASLYSSQNSDMIIYEDKGLSSANQLEKDKATSTVGLEMNDWKLRQIRYIQRNDAMYFSDDGKSSVASSPSRICPRCLEKEREKSNGEHNKMSTVFLDKQTSVETTGVQFDSGIDMVHCGEPIKNISFETSTSSDSAVPPSVGCNKTWKPGGILKGSSHNGANNFAPCANNSLRTGVKQSSNQCCQTDPTPMDSACQTCAPNEPYCETVTTFGVKPNSMSNNAPCCQTYHNETMGILKATDV